MSGVCSWHPQYQADCHACNATPAMVLGVTEEEWDRKKAEAEATGIAPCHYCGFEQYRNHNNCVKCGVPDWDYYEGSKS